MTSFKKYFTYHFKNTFWRLAIIAVLCILPVATSVWINNSYRSYSYIDLSILSYIATVISTIIPVLELLPFKNRRNIDTILFLPTERRKIASVHFINGLIHVLLINAVTFITTYFILIIHSYPFEIWNLFLLFAFTLLESLAVYSISSFIFDRANTAADGIIWMIFYSFILCRLFKIIRNIILYVLYIVTKDSSLYQSMSNSVYSRYFSPYFIPIFAWGEVSDLLFPYLQITADGNITIPPYTSNVTEISEGNMYGIIIWSILIPILIFGFIWLFKYKRPENIGSTSNSLFGYKVILPLFAITSRSYTLSNIALMSIVLVTGYIIYRRSMRFKLADYISIAVVLISQLTMFFTIRNI